MTCTNIWTTLLIRTSITKQQQANGNTVCIDGWCVYITNRFQPMLAFNLYSDTASLQQSVTFRSNVTHQRFDNERFLFSAIL